MELRRGEKMLRRRHITPIVLPISADDLLSAQEHVLPAPIPHPIAPAPADVREILQFFHKVDPPRKQLSPQVVASDTISKELGFFRHRGESRPQPMPSVVDPKALQNALGDFRRIKKQKE
jgi:hypothetical protein